MHFENLKFFTMVSEEHVYASIEVVTLEKKING